MWRWIQSLKTHLGIASTGLQRKCIGRWFTATAYELQLMLFNLRAVPPSWSFSYFHSPVPHSAPTLHSVSFSSRCFIGRTACCTVFYTCSIWIKFNLICKLQNASSTSSRYFSLSVYLPSNMELGLRRNFFWLLAASWICICAQMLKIYVWPSLKTNWLVKCKGLA